MDILAQSALVAAVTSFALGVSVLARNVRNKLFLAYFVTCLFVAVWAFSFFLEKVWGTSELARFGPFYRIHLLFNVWLAPVSLVFIRVMVKVTERVSRRLLDLSVASALTLSVALFLRFETTPWVLQIIYYLPGFVVLQTLRLMWIDRRLRRRFRALRRNLIYAGALLALATSVMDHAPWLGKVVPSLGNIGLAIYMFFLSQAVTQQRLLNFPALVSRFFVLLVFALSLTAVYALLVAWVEDNPGLFFMNSFIASFLLLMLIEPIRALVRGATERLLTQKHRRLQEAVREAQRKLSGVVDPGALFQLIQLTTEQLLQPQRGELFVLRSEGTRFRRVRAFGEEASGLREVLADHPLLDYCAKLKRRGDLPIVLDQMLENEMDRSATQSQRDQFGALDQGLKAFRSNLFIPFIDGEKILGFLALHVPSPPEPWAGNWGALALLYPYFELAAQTMRNLEVYARQREKERLATIGEMAAGLAHEIRNPLGAIKGAAQFLDPSADRPESRFLKVIVEEVDRLNRVVTQFLDYSKPSRMDLQKVDASDLTARAIERLRPGLSPGVELRLVASRGATLVLAAAEQIQQVLLNLVQNSMKALEGRATGHITVSVVGAGPGNAEVNIVVEDDGPGIAKDNLEKIFIPFFTTSPSGTGLGLPICQKIVEAHRGRIEVVTEEGRFTRVSVVLPAVEN